MAIRLLGSIAGALAIRGAAMYVFSYWKDLQPEHLGAVQINESLQVQGTLFTNIVVKWMLCMFIAMVVNFWIWETIAINEIHGGRRFRIVRNRDGVVEVRGFRLAMRNRPYIVANQNQNMGGAAPPALRGLTNLPDVDTRAALEQPPEEEIENAIDTLGELNQPDSENQIDYLE